MCCTDTVVVNRMNGKELHHGIYHSAFFVTCLWCRPIANTWRADNVFVSMKRKF